MEKPTATMMLAQRSIDCGKTKDRKDQGYRDRHSPSHPQPLQLAHSPASDFSRLEVAGENPQRVAEEVGQHNGDPQRREDNPHIFHSVAPATISILQLSWAVYALSVRMAPNP
jgi:hypothetical protein